MLPSQRRSEEAYRAQLRKPPTRSGSTNSATVMGAVAIVGIAAVIGGAYLLDRPSKPETVTASCVREERNGARTVVADSQCSGTGSGGSYSKTSTTWPQYRYYYGGNAQLGQAPTGGSTIKPSNVEIKTKSGTVIQRGGLGRGGGGSGS